MTILPKKPRSENRRDPSGISGVNSAAGQGVAGNSVGVGGNQSGVPGSRKAQSGDPSSNSSVGRNRESAYDDNGGSNSSAAAIRRRERLNAAASARLTAARSMNGAYGVGSSVGSGVGNGGSGAASSVVVPVTSANAVGASVVGVGGKQDGTGVSGGGGGSVGVNKVVSSASASSSVVAGQKSLPGQKKLKGSIGGSLVSANKKKGSVSVSGGTSISPELDQDEDSRDGDRPNSEDEYEPAPAGDQSPNSAVERERAFVHELERKGLAVKPMAEDGACLFRAVADQVYGDQDMHGTVRQLTMDYMEQNRDHYSQFVTEDFSEYINRKRRPTEHGNQIEIQAISEVFNRPVQIFQYGNEPINTFNAEMSSHRDNPPIRVSYHGRVHYNSVIEPWGAATVGVGLGLPGLKPNYSQVENVRKTLMDSDRDDIENTMLADKIRATDMDETEDKIKEAVSHFQVARESYLQYMREQEEQMYKDHPCMTAGMEAMERGFYDALGTFELATIVILTFETHSGSLPKSSNKSTASSRQQQSKSSSSNNKSQQQKAQASTSKLPPSRTGSPKLSDSYDNHNNNGENVGLNDFETESDLMARVMAESQRTYLETLKRQRHTSSNNSPSSSQNTRHYESSKTDGTNVEHSDGQDNNNITKNPSTSTQ